MMKAWVLGLFVFIGLVGGIIFGIKTKNNVEKNTNLFIKNRTELLDLKGVVDGTTDSLGILDRLTNLATHNGALEEEFIKRTDLQKKINKAQQKINVDVDRRLKELENKGSIKKETIQKQVSVRTPDLGDTAKLIYHNGYAKDDYRQKYIQYAWKISGGDKDFILTLNAENGLRDPNRQSEVRDIIYYTCRGAKKTKTEYNGFTQTQKNNCKPVKKREDSRGFCQLHRNRHSKVVDDPRFKSDPYRQLDQCLAKYKGGTRFYGYNQRWKSAKYFKF